MSDPIVYPPGRCDVPFIRADDPALRRDATICKNCGRERLHHITVRAVHGGDVTICATTFAADDAPRDKVRKDWQGARLQMDSMVTDADNEASEPRATIAEQSRIIDAVRALLNRARSIALYKPTTITLDALDAALAQTDERKAETE